jgi:response regulator RpfG family c-di-GMP phosphodiesterase
MINRSVLFVDDESTLLDTYRRLLGRHFRVETANGPGAGLAAVAQNGPFAVIVSDLRMPRMNGNEFLAKVRAIAPDSVRILLTGFANTEAAVAAVNEGHVFRFLNKPCPHDHMVKSLEAGVEQYRLVLSERELLDRTLAGSIRALTEILGLLSPDVMGRASRVRRTMRHLARELGLANAWQYELAGLLSQIGCFIVQPKILDKVWDGQDLSPEEDTLYRSHPKVGSRLLSHIPRLDSVVWMIARQQDGPLTGEPSSAEEQNLAMGSMMLQVSLMLDQLVARGLTVPQAMEILRRPPDGYPPRLLEALGTFNLDQKPKILERLRIDELGDSMVLAEDVHARNGLVLLTKGHEVNTAVKLRLQSIASGIGVVEPIPVWVTDECQDIPVAA